MAIVARILARAAGRALMTLYVVITAIFMSAAFVGGNPVDLMVDPRLTGEARAQIENRFGYDASLGHQYLKYVGALSCGNLGYSFVFKRPVSRLLAERLPSSVLLGALALLFAALLCSFGLLMSNWNDVGWVTNLGRTWSLLLLLLPAFLWAGVCRWVLGTQFGWFPFLGEYPQTPWQWLAHASLPALSISLPLAGYAQVYLQEKIDEASRLPFVLSARGRGLARWRVMIGHVAPQLVPGLIQLLGGLLPVLAGGALIVECVFGWPGMGLLLHDGVLGRDLPLVAGSSIVIGMLTMIGYDGAAAWRASIDRGRVHEATG